MNSKYRLAFIGTVASDIAIGSRVIDVYPHEHLVSDGDINQSTRSNSQLKDSEDKSYNVDVENEQIIKNVVWTNPNSNRVTPPNVKKGEKVKVYQYADSNKFYWTTMGSEMDIRGLEHVEWAFVNTDDENVTVMDDKNCYKVVISTKNKIIAIRTPDNDGEVTTYELSIDTKNGIALPIKDGFGNEIRLISFAGDMNIDTTNSITLNTQHAIVNAKETTTVNTKIATINADDSATINTKSAVIAASDDATIKTGKMTIQSTSLDINP